MKTRALLVTALAVAVAWGSGALAGEKKEREGKRKAQQVIGTLNEATVAADTVTWKITAEDGTDKEFPMPTNVVVMYVERGGQNRAIQIRVAGKKVPEAKGKRQVAQGTLKAVAIEGKKVTVTVTVENEDKPFMLTKKVRITAREKRDGSTAAFAIGPARGKRKKGEGDQPAEGKKNRKRKKGEEAPANM